MNFVMMMKTRMCIWWLCVTMTASLSAITKNTHTGTGKQQGFMILASNILKHDRLTVYIQYSLDNKIAHYVIDFYEPEIHYFDIEFNTHWVDDVFIQKNADGKFSISFGSGECDFRYKFAKVNRCWVDIQK